MTQEEKAKAYDKAIERAKEYNFDGAKQVVKDLVTYIFPELKESESEDERIRKAIIEHFNRGKGLVFPELEEKYNTWITWLEKQGNLVKYYEDKLDKCACDNFNKGYKKALEKQREQKLDVEPKFRIGDTITPNGKKEYYTITDIVDGWYEFKEKHVNGGIPIYYQFGWELVEQKPADKVEPKFKVGNWYQCTKDFFGKGVTFDKNTAYYCAKEECLQDEFGCHIAIVKDLYDNFKLWTIQDAKDGDVLVNGSNIFIFHFINDTRLMGYCHINTDDGRFYDDIGKNECFCLIDAVVNPATKEQRDKLEKAMVDAGYTFDFEKKELKKLEQPSTWSEEDEEMLQGIWDEILANKHEAKEYEWKTYDKFLTWLQSLKPHHHWIPTKRQMECFEDFLLHIPSTNPNKVCLTGIYEELKNLT